MNGISRNRTGLLWTLSMSAALFVAVAAEASQGDDAFVNDQNSATSAQIQKEAKALGTKIFAESPSNGKSLVAFESVDACHPPHLNRYTYAWGRPAGCDARPMDKICLPIRGGFTYNHFVSKGHYCYCVRGHIVCAS